MAAQVPEPRMRKIIGRGARLWLRLAYARLSWLEPIWDDPHVAIGDLRVVATRPHDSASELAPTRGTKGRLAHMGLRGGLAAELDVVNDGNALVANLHKWMAQRIARNASLEYANGCEPTQWKAHARENSRERMCGRASGQRKAEGACLCTQMRSCAGVRFRWAGWGRGLRCMANPNGEDKAQTVRHVTP